MQYWFTPHLSIVVIINIFHVIVKYTFHFIIHMPHHSYISHMALFYWSNWVPKWQIWVTCGSLLCSHINMLTSSCSLIVIQMDMWQPVGLSCGTSCFTFSLFLLKLWTTITFSFGVRLRLFMHCWKDLIELYAMDSFSRSFEMINFGVF